MTTKYKYVLGVDEAGRGPLAGPVSVGVVCVPTDFDWSQLLGVNDSKKLTEKKREEIFKAAQKLKASEQLDYAVSMVSAKKIDEIGIVPSITLAMNRALDRINSNPKQTEVKLDGGLKAPIQYIYQETIIKGDSKEKVIGLASIMAKVTRDHYMVKKSLDEKYMLYGFEQHKGYGTKQHREAVRTYGRSTEHRQSFCKNIPVE